uniref:Minor capsid protein P8 central region domain-containing protein n=1 Tax=viral metagenome TaxID=1070528 RepID=A0A6C0HVL5_9ZZZZ
MLSYNNYKPTDKEREFVGKLINIEPNDISYKFFSDVNIDYINSSLINMVMEETYKRYEKRIQIQPQRKHIVIAAMRHIYFKNIKNVLTADEEVARLNKEVLRQMLGTAMTELIAYLRYIHDYNNIIPLELPKSDSIKIDSTLPGFSSLFDY